MSYAINQPVPWPVPPDWADGIRERLEFLTEVIPAKNGRLQKRRLRQAPRRVFEFDVINDAQARRVADAMLMDHGGRYWMLPIWHDVQLLPAQLDAAESFIPCKTAGFDFVEEGYALLWLALNQWQLVGIDEIEAEGLALGSLTSRDWPAGTRLYPVRRARLAEQPSETIWSDAAGKRAVAMIIDEPCDWLAVLPATTYRGYPVLEWRPEESEDGSATFTRQLETVDAGTGPVSVYDYPGRPFRSGDLRWQVYGREEHSALRSLIYGLAGRFRSVWLPTWNIDLVLASDVAANATSLTVEWAGYAVFGRLQSNWRDIRIELVSGTVFYRRITSAAETGETEVLGIDAQLGQAVQRGQVRSISFLVFSALSSDVIELRHETDADGLTTCATSFIGERNDV